MEKSNTAKLIPVLMILKLSSSLNTKQSILKFVIASQQFGFIHITYQHKKIMYPKRIICRNDRIEVSFCDVYFPYGNSRKLWKRSQKVVKRLIIRHYMLVPRNLVLWYVCPYIADFFLGLFFQLIFITFIPLLSLNFFKLVSHMNSITEFL